MLPLLSAGASLPLLPIGVGILALGAWWATSSRKSGNVSGSVGAEGMTPERQIIYQTALCSCKDPVKLETLSETYRKYGLTLQADMLKKRANLRRLPKEMQDKRREIYKAGLKLTDPTKVFLLANAFEKEGATGAAASLKKYAEGLVQAA